MQCHFFFEIFHNFMFYLERMLVHLEQPTLALHHKPFKVQVSLDILLIKSRIDIIMLYNWIQQYESHFFNKFSITKKIHKARNRCHNLHHWWHLANVKPDEQCTSSFSKFGITVSMLYRIDINPLNT